MFGSRSATTSMTVEDKIYSRPGLDFKAVGICACVCTWEELIWPKVSVAPNSQLDFPQSPLSQSMWQKSFQVHFHWFYQEKSLKTKKTCLQLSKAEHPRTEGFVPKTEEEISQVSDQNQARKHIGFKQRVHPDWKQAAAASSCCVPTWRQSRIAPLSAHRVLIIFLIFHIFVEDRLICETYFYTNILTQPHFFFWGFRRRLGIPNNLAFVLQLLFAEFCIHTSFKPPVWSYLDSLGGNFSINWFGALLVSTPTGVRDLLPSSQKHHDCFTALL